MTGADRGLWKKQRETVADRGTSTETDRRTRIGLDRKTWTGAGKCKKNGRPRA